MKNKIINCIVKKPRKHLLNNVVNFSRVSLKVRNQNVIVTPQNYKYKTEHNQTQKKGINVIKQLRNS